ncbi:MAG: exodeoxyribonuclease V subunit gamma [Clostridia bacterium]|nr:exodeoxyribonuclease V subunit gamma [Clostridia bacterium]
MLYRVIGASGSGKTDYIISRLGEAIKQKKRCFVIVPEQQSVDYEAMLCQRFGDSSNLCCEVLNFERLPNRVAREFGGLAINSIDKGGACALLSLISESLKEQLTEFKSVAEDADFAASIFNLISRMKMALITPQMLFSAIDSNSLENEPRLISKIKDIALIYNEYEKYFGDNLFDPRDALTRLSEELKHKNFFKNSYVFIDSYYNFTEQEYEVIKHIVAQSRDTYISFTVDENREFFYENAKAADRIKRLSKVGCEDYYTAEPKRTKHECLKFIERNLWCPNIKPLNKNDGSVRLITAKNRFDEVEAAAAEITEFIRAGGRYKDITVLAGNVSNYSSIVDSVFSRAEIPCYMSSKEELSSKPVFSFLLSSLAVIIEDFSLRSMKRYIKTGYTDLTVSESDAVLNYAYSWKLRGKAWYSENDWMLDPEGYREGDLTKRGAKLLNKANSAKKKVVPPLVALKETLTKKDLTVSEAVRALYNHLIVMEADEKLRKNAENALKNGDREESEREIQLWKLLINIFDQLDSLCGNMKTSPKRMVSLMKLMCDCYSLGAIPPSSDSVTFGDASLIRAGGSKLVIVLGVCDGEFPASTSSGGFFDRDEAVVLEGVGLQLADTMDKLLNTGRFFVYAALSAPTERLVLSYPRSELSGEELRPSTAWFSVKNMLPEIEEKEFSGDELIYSRESIASYFPTFENGELKSEIKNALNNKRLPFFEELPSVSDSVSRIDFNKDKLLLSPSKFERYVLCPFSFFANYLLDLKEKKEIAFASPEIGTFIHKVLELYLKECVSSGKFVAPNDADREKMVRAYADEYFENVIGEAEKNNKRFVHTFENAVKTLSFVTESLTKEFSQSKFMPTGFEFSVGLKNPDIPAIEYDRDGKKVLLRGSIDRVDTYEVNGEKYVRVVDYKTYNKPFSLTLTANGLDTQMLHYLFAYCEATGAKPAGVLYYTVKLPNVDFSGRETPEKIKSEIEKSINRSGVLLKDLDIVRAMSPDCAYVPTSITAKNEFSKRSNNLLTDEEFTVLSNTLKEQVETLADNVFCGKMDVTPNDFDGKADPCKFCPHGDFCRNRKEMEEDEDNELYSQAD